LDNQSLNTGWKDRGSRPIPLIEYSPEKIERLKKMARELLKSNPRFYTHELFSYLPVLQVKLKV